MFVSQTISTNVMDFIIYVFQFEHSFHISALSIVLNEAITNFNQFKNSLVNMKTYLVFCTAFVVLCGLTVSVFELNLKKSIFTCFFCFS